MDKNLLTYLIADTDCLQPEEIGGYLRSSLPREHTRRVENHLLDCPLCSEAVEAFGESPEALVAPLPDFATFQKKLPSSSEGEVRRMEPGRWLKRAISVAALLAIAVSVFLFQSRMPANGNLYDEYFTSYENDISLTLRNGDTISPLHSSFQSALYEYSTHNYTGSISHFEEALLAEPDNDAARFFAGMACLESGLPDQALVHLEKAAHTTGHYSRKAAWYQILALLKLDRQEEAKVLLTQFAAIGGYKAREAAALLDRL